MTELSAYINAARDSIGEIQVKSESYINKNFLSGGWNDCRGKKFGEELSAIVRNAVCDISRTVNALDKFESVILYKLDKAESDLENG